MTTNKNMDTPYVSIIIPTFNRSHLLDETLNSVYKQVFEAWECIVIDDGSNDQTEETVRRYKDKDDRFSFYKRPEYKPKGAAACRNFGLEYAKGELIQFLDDDDLLDKKKLEEQVKIYDNCQSIVTSKWGWFSDISSLEQRFKSQYHCYKNFLRPVDLLRCFGTYDEYLPLHSYLISKHLIEKCGNWNEELGNNDDSEFMTRIILHADKILFASKARVFYRTGNLNKLSEFDSAEKLRSAIKSWKLIEQQLKLNANLGSSIYTLNAKRNLSYYAIKEYPVIYDEELDFLKFDQWKFFFLRRFNRIRY